MKGLQQIGKGTFSTVYQLTPNKVLIKSEDYVKECMSMGWFPDSNLFPKVTTTNHRNEYTMTYYPKVKSLKNSLVAADYTLYNELRALKDGLPWNYDYDQLLAAFKGLKNRRASKALVHALEALANYGSDVRFEISPRNVAVSKAGRLVLLDCFFMASQLQQVRSPQHETRY